MPRTDAGVAFRAAPAPGAYDPRVRADAELVERAAAGDRDAFAALYDRYATPVHDLLRRMLRDDHEASEIGRAHVCTPVTNAHLVCRLLLEKKKRITQRE